MKKPTKKEVKKTIKKKMVKAPKNTMIDNNQEETKAIVEVPSSEVVESNRQLLSVDNLLLRVVQQKLPVETAREFMQLRREAKAEWAKEQFDNAMAKFQMDCPIIEKKKDVKNDAGEVIYKYAPIEDILRAVKPIMLDNGFSFRIKTETGDMVKAICVVTHIKGHSEESEMQVPKGTKTRMMSDTQVVAAALTFAKRYAFCNAFGILTGDEDNDGRDFGKAEQVKDDLEFQKNKVIAFIDQCKDASGLLDLKSKLEGSDKYTKEQKKEVCGKVEDKLAELGFVEVK